MTGGTGDVHAPGPSPVPPSSGRARGSAWITPDADEDSHLQGSRSVVGLVVPADLRARLLVTVMAATPSQISAAIGGGLVEDVLTGQVGGAGYTFYLDQNRVTRGLPSNDRAAVLAARLGHTRRGVLAGMRGDVLVLGCRGLVEDVSVPRGVVDAARQSALILPEPDTGQGTGR